MNTQITDTDGRPEQQFVTQHLTVAASQLVKGDRTLHGVVVRVDNKRTKSHVTFEGNDTPQLFEQSVDVAVDRQVETEASIDARKAFYIERRCEDYLRNFAKAAQDARDEVATYLAKGYVSNDAVYTAVFTGYLDHRTRNFVDGANDGKVTWTRATEILSEQFRDELVEDQSAQWSGGFSYHNAEEQAQRSAKQRFVRDVRWWL